MLFSIVTSLLFVVFRGAEDSRILCISSPNKLRHIRSQNGQNVERLVAKRRREKFWSRRRCFAFLEPTVSCYFVLWGLKRLQRHCFNCLGKDFDKKDAFSTSLKDSNGE